MKINVKLKGIKDVIQLDYAEIGEADGEFCVRASDGTAVAKFKCAELAGWWKEPEFGFAEDDRKEALEIVKKLEASQ